MSSAVPRLAGTPLGEVDTGRLVAAVAELAADPYAGRRVGTAGGRAAGSWLAARLRRLGAVVRLQEFPVTGVRELSALPVLRWQDQSWRHRRDSAVHLASADLPVPRTGDLGVEPVSGRWVLASAVEPGLVAQAVAAGAAGLVIPRGVDAGGWMPKMITGPAVQPIPIVSVRTDLHARLLAERGVLTATLPLRTVAVTGRNVHGVFAEPAPGAVSVLLTAHYDGVGDDPDQRLPAAADNASGVAVVLEAARTLAATVPAGLGLAVALLDAEEAGAQGSAYHAPQVPPGTHVINIDGAGKLDGPAAVEAGGPAQPLLAALDAAGRQVGVALRAGAMPSDNRRYAATGLPAVGIGMGVPGYQTPAETVDRIDPATLADATRLVVATVDHLTHR
ncbi:MAG TPA: M28 family peptidase [Actinophytocola sp.]|uniref:M28 family metallopeptidase n=1 Tax=Actinophytocola sp. TaxID=1872138 RepID=UPI002DB854A5|nr:M28 family peptidase [Actinophytocola sp.]HEU5469479.1 M28 family peptidase [Actinophytocola sp.]